MTNGYLNRALAAFTGVVLLAVGLAPRAGAQTPAVLTVSGQVLDSEQGFLFFTTGDGFRVDKNVKISDYATKKPSSEIVRARLYARATFDPATETIVSIELSHKALPLDTDYALVKKYAVVLSTPAPNPDLALIPASTSGNGKPGTSQFKEALNGKPVLVSWIVQVPPTTPLTSAVYISTDASGWNPQAIPMDRIDALHYRVIQYINSGTILHYHYTRGSQTTAERAQNGLEAPPRTMEIVNLDVKNREDVVYHWNDESLSGQQTNPLAVPTPYNPNPFGNLPHNPALPVPTPPH